MEIMKLADRLFNGALPIVGTIAGAVVVNTKSQMQPGTGIPIAIGAFLFGAITGFGPGERSHRYLGGGLAQVVPLFVGITLFSNEYHSNRFDLGNFFVATAVSITAQVFLRELMHLPEVLRNQHSGGSSSSAPSSSATTANGPTDTANGGSSASSSALVSYGVSGNNSTTLSTFVPQMEGLTVAAPGTTIIEIETEEHTDRHLLHGNTTMLRRKYKTAEGGLLEEHSYKHSGWLGSKTKNKRNYTAGSGTYGSVPNSGGGNSSIVKIEEVTDD